MKRYEKIKCGYLNAPSIWASVPVKSHPQRIRCVLQRETTHFLLHPAISWCLIGSTGRSDVYGYNLIVSYAGEGGRYLQVEGKEAFSLLPPSPIQHCFALSNPRKEGGAAGPLSVVLARSPMVGGVWLQQCYEVAAPVRVPRSLGGQTKHPLPISSPVWPGAAVPTPQTRWTLVDLQAFAGPKTWSSTAFTPRQSSPHTAEPGCPCLWLLWW